MNIVNINQPCLVSESWAFTSPCNQVNMLHTQRKFPYPGAKKRFILCDWAGKTYVGHCPPGEVRVGSYTGVSLNTFNNVFWRQNQRCEIKHWYQIYISICFADFFGHLMYTRREILTVHLYTKCIWHASLLIFAEMHLNF